MLQRWFHGDLPTRHVSRRFTHLAYKCMYTYLGQRLPQGLRDPIYTSQLSSLNHHWGCDGSVSGNGRRLRSGGKRRLRRTTSTRPAMMTVKQTSTSNQAASGELCPYDHSLTRYGPRLWLPPDAVKKTLLRQPTQRTDVAKA